LAVFHQNSLLEAERLSALEKYLTGVYNFKDIKSSDTNIQEVYSLASTGRICKSRRENKKTPVETTGVSPLLHLEN
jgi:hypothetical protein